MPEVGRPANDPGDVSLTRRGRRNPPPPSVLAVHSPAHIPHGTEQCQEHWEQFGLEAALDSPVDRLAA